jgi:putative colanic acid biosynthesis glycosyltransferase
MRILQIDVNYGNSSTGNIVSAIQHTLDLTGHEGHVIFGRKTKRDFSGGTRVASTIEVIGHAALSRITGYEGVFSPLATKKICNIILKFRPDIVHLHDLHGYWLNTLDLLDFLIQQRMPTLWTFHCEYPYTGRCGHAHECEKWQTVCDACPQLKSYPKSLIFDRSKLLFKKKKLIAEKFQKLHIVCPSDWLSRRARQSIFSQQSIETIHNGIDTQIFRPDIKSSMKLEGSELRIGFVGRDFEGGNKGGDIALKVANAMQGEAQFFAIDCEKIARNLMLPTNITPKGRLSQIGLASFMNEIDLFLLTSRRETFSLITAEAIACGVPVVGINSGAPSEIVTDALHGALADMTKVHQLPEIIRAYKENGLLANNPFLKQARHRHIAYNFSLEKMCRAYMHAYQNLMELHKL